MKYLQRFLSLLFALATCVSLFSVTALAEESEYYISSDIVKYTGLIEDWIWSYNYPLVDSGQAYFRDDSTRFDNTVYYRSDLFIEKYDESLIAEAHDDITFHLNNVYREIQLVKGNDVTSVLWRALDSLQLIAVHTDGTYTYYDNDTIQFNYDPNTLFGNFKAQFRAEKDIRKLIVRTTYNPTVRTGLTGDWDYSFLIMGYDDVDATCTIAAQTEEAGLLSGILGKLSDVWNTLKDGFTNMINAITELPQKLWEKIENGLKSLFVPSEETIIKFKDDMDLLLSSRLGAVYEAVDILHNGWNDIMTYDDEDVVYMPAVTLNFSGTDFTFGDYDIDIVPSGFEALADAIKILSGIVATLLFLSGLRKRYDEVMGVET